MFAIGFIFNCVFVVAIFPQRKFRMSMILPATGANVTGLGKKSYLLFQPEAEKLIVNLVTIFVASNKSLVDQSRESGFDRIRGYQPVFFYELAGG